MSRHSEALIYALRVLREPQNLCKIRKIYLYGSCARKQQKYDSDVDLFLVTERLSASEIAKLRSCVNSGDSKLPEVEVKISFTERFSSSQRFNKNLEREAILLWERDHTSM